MPKLATVEFVSRKAKREMIDAFRENGYAIDVMEERMYGHGRFVVFEGSWNPAEKNDVVTIEDVPKKHQPK